MTTPAPTPTTSGEPGTAELGTAARAVLAFAQSQARPEGVTDGDAVLADLVLPLGARREPLDAGLHRLLDRLDAGAGGPGAAPRGAWQRLQLVLHGAFGAQRWEPTHPYNPHRAFPSPRCAFTTHAVVLDGHGGPWYFDPYGHELVALGAPDGPAPPGRDGAGPAASVGAAGGATVALLGNASTLPPGYGELRYPLALLEGGHALAAACLVARATGVAPAVRLGFDDAAVLQATGADPAHGWVPLALVDLGARSPLHRAAHRGAAHRGFEARPGDPDRAAWLGARAVDAWSTAVRRAPAPAHRARGTAGGEALAPTPLPPAPPAGAAPPRRARPLGRLLFERTAGRARTGATGAPEPLPAGLTRALLEAAADPADLGLGQRPWVTGLRCLVVVERTEDLPDGLYEWRPDGSGDQLVQLRPGQLMDRVGEAFSYPQEWVRVDSFNQAWFLVADYRDVLRRLGPRGFRVCQLEVGSVAQALGTAATAGGAFARPCRSFHHDLLVPLLGLAPHETVAYEVLVARNRFEDLTVDLRP